MVIFKNLNYVNYLCCYYERRIILYGAGGTLCDFLRMNRAKVALTDKVDYILDSDPAKAGVSFNIGLRTVSVKHIDEFAQREVDMNGYIIILCVGEKFVLDVIGSLDRIGIFDNVVCLYGITALSWGKEAHVPPGAGKMSLPAPKKKYNIPKVIHYCWFGDEAMSETEKECIASWREHCPDFELKFWNEDNYDVSKTPLYVRQAYGAKKYAFVSDYARLDIVYRYGGFYLDTDVLLLRSLKPFTKYRSVFGYLAWNEIATGLGFGSMAGNDDLLEQMKLYEQLLFINDGEMNLTPCPEYTTDCFRRKGLPIDNSLRLVRDTLFLPSDCLCSLMPVYGSNGQYYLSFYALTENSYALHRCASTWFEADNYNAFENAKSVLADINARLLSDWRREMKSNG
jgi:hypothetical protein